MEKLTAKSSQKKNPAIQDVCSVIVAGFISINHILEVLKSALCVKII